MNKYIRLLLAFILLLAFLLRYFEVTQNPPSLNWDEVSIGYNAYSILKTGKDEWGKKLPVHFKSYGEYKLPLQVYLSIPAISIFGLNPLGVRITPVIYGVTTVYLMYILGFLIFKKKSIALVSAFFLAVSPWHIQLTRASFESSFALFWVLLGMIFLIKGFSEKKYWFYAVFPLVLSMYTYNSARAFVPLFILLIIPFYFTIFKRFLKTLIISGIIGITLIIPIIIFIITGEGSARYKLVSVTDELGLIPRVEQIRNTTSVGSPFKELFYNRYTFIVSTVARNYFTHFTPDFLFISGAGHKQHHPQNIGELYWVQAPFLVYGLYLLFKSKEKFRWILVIWLVTAFIPVSFTMDSIPHALRTLNAAPVFELLSAFGVVVVFERLTKSKTNPAVFIILFSILFLFQFIRYLIDFNFNYPILYSRDWQYGNREAVEYIKNNYERYDLIVYTREYGEPHMFTLFYLNYPPVKFQNSNNLVRYETHDWVRVERFDKFYFPDLGDTNTTLQKIREEFPNKKILFIGTDSEIDDNLNIVKTINFLDGNIAFQIVE